MRRRSVLLSFALGAAIVVPVLRAHASTFTAACPGVTLKLQFANGVGPLSGPTAWNIAPENNPANPQPEGTCRRVDIGVPETHIDIKGRGDSTFVTCQAISLGGAVDVRFAEVNKDFTGISVSANGSLTSASVTFGPSNDVLGAGTLHSDPGTEANCLNGGIGAGQIVTFTGNLAFDP